MIDHVSLAVRDLARATRFYEAVLGAIGFAKLEVRPATVGFGKRYAELWLNHHPAGAPGAAQSGVHVCLRAPKALQRSTPSMRRRSRPAAPATARRGQDRNMGRATMRRSFATPTAIGSRR